MTKTYKVPLPDPISTHEGWQTAGGWYPENARRQKDKPFLDVPDSLYRMYVARLHWDLRSMLHRLAQHRDRGIKGKVKIKELRESWRFIKNYEKFCEVAKHERTLFAATRKEPKPL